MSGKRKAPAPTAHDAKLERVARALDSVTRVGETFANGTCERAPFPAIAFRNGGQDQEERYESLGLPSRQEIRARGSVSQRHGAKAVAWEVDGDQLESRNPRWRSFLDERVRSLSKRLGIAPFARVEIKLSKLILAETGARLLTQPRESEERAESGVFATLLVVFPGSFEGGDVVVHRLPQKAPRLGDEGEQDRRKADTWRPSARESTFDLSYAVFYDMCTSTAEPIASGTAVCLAYNLMTTTPTDIPAFAGATRVERAVGSALTEFFNVTPEPLAKQLKINPDAWRTINSFATDSQFVYILPGEEHDDLRREEDKIAHSLAAFCVQSGGDFVLYHTDALCSREMETSVTLRSPWIKHGTTRRFEFPPIYLEYRKAVAPLTRVDKLPFRPTSRFMDPIDIDIVDHLNDYQNGRQRKIYRAKALVVLPVSIELRQLGELPIDHATTDLLNFECQDTAIQFARRIMRYRLALSVFNDADVQELKQFVAAAVKINDCQLFLDTLRILDLQYVVDDDSLRAGVEFFGWDACERVVTERLSSTDHWIHRINIFLSIIQETSEDANRFERLLDALVANFPWVLATERTRQDDIPDANSRAIFISTFCRLLRVVYLSCPGRLIDIVSVRTPTDVTQVVVPGMLALVQLYPGEELLRAACIRVWEIFKPLAAELQRMVFTGLEIPEHCEPCAQLRSFLSSTATEITLRFTDATQTEHIADVVWQATWHQAKVKIKGMGKKTIRLKKKPRHDAAQLVYEAEDLENRMQLAVALFDKRGRT